MNLFESNVVHFAFVADYWGPMGPGNTFFRNRFQGNNRIFSGLMIQDGSHRQTVVNNTFITPNAHLTVNNLLTVRRSKETFINGNKWKNSKYKRLAEMISLAPEIALQAIQIKKDGEDGKVTEAGLANPSEIDAGELANELEGFAKGELKFNFPNSLYRSDDDVPEFFESSPFPNQGADVVGRELGKDALVLPAEQRFKDRCAQLEDPSRGAGLNNRDKDFIADPCLAYTKPDAF